MSRVIQNVGELQWKCHLYQTRRGYEFSYDQKSQTITSLLQSTWTSSGVSSALSGHSRIQPIEHPPCSVLSITLEERNRPLSLLEQQFKCCRPRVTYITCIHIPLPRINHIGIGKANMNCDCIVCSAYTILKILGRHPDIYHVPKAQQLITNSTHL